MKMYKVILPRGIIYDIPKYKPMVLKLFKFNQETYRWKLENELDYLGASNVKLTEENFEQLLSEENCEFMMNFFETLESIGIKFEPNQ